MKYFLKGIFFGFTLVIIQKLCCLLFSDLNSCAIITSSACVFFAVATAFLTSDKISNLLLCGFSGLFFMFWGEMLYMMIFDGLLSGISWFDAYLGGLYGSMAALVLSLFLTAKHITLFKFSKEMLKMTIEKNMKIKLLIYGLISAASFSYLCMPENAGISIPLFIIIEFLCLLFIIPNKKKTLFIHPHIHNFLKQLYKCKQCLGNVKFLCNHCTLHCPVYQIRF